MADFGAIGYAASRILGGGIAIGGNIIASRRRRKAYRRAMKLYNDRMDQLRAHRDKVYYQDPGQSAETQAAVQAIRELQDDQAERAAGVQAVTGATDESVALQKQAASKQVADIMSNAAVTGAARKEQAWKGADSSMDAFTNYLANMKLQKGLSDAKYVQQQAGALADMAYKAGDISKQFSPTLSTMDSAGGLTGMMGKEYL